MSVMGWTTTDGFFELEISWPDDGGDDVPAESLDELCAKLEQTAAELRIAFDPDPIVRRASRLFTPGQGS